MKKQIEPEESIPTPYPAGLSLSLSQEASKSSEDFSENKAMAIRHELSEDVLMEILSRIPAKSLLRFKLVSKQWYFLIQNPIFISLHHTRSQPYDCISLMSKVENHLSQWSMYLLPTRKKTCSSIQELDLSFTSPHLNKEFTHQGTCNGIMCLSLNSKIVICNPATREYRLLPQPPYNTRLWRTNYLGFAFDSKTNDYQVVRVDTLQEFTHVDHKIHLYRMSADLWEEIVIKAPNHDFTGSHRHPCTSLDGVFYWLSFGSYSYFTGSSVHTIDALNTVEGSFEQRSLPVGIGSKLHTKLFLLKDCLALVVPTSDYDYLLQETEFNVWLMDKYGGKECWTKKYTIGILKRNLRPFGFRPNSEVLMTGCDYGLIVSYNLSTGDIEEYIQLCNFPELRCLTQVFQYSESLVSVKRQVDFVKRQVDVVKRRVDLALPGWLIYTLRNMVGKGKAHQSASGSSS